MTSENKTAIVLLGHSHAGAVIEALSRRALPSDGNATIYVHDVWAHRTNYAHFDDNGALIFNDQVMRAIDELVQPDVTRHYVSMLGGNGHVVFSLSRHPRPFDFVLPERPDLPLEDAIEVLPSEYVKRSLMPFTMPYVWQLIGYRQACGQSVTQIETPPPCGDDDYLRTHLGAYVPDPSNVVSRWLRLKMWRLHSAVIRGFCDEHDVRFLAASPSAFDREGFLHRDAFGPDATHGNAWYGDRVLDQLEATFGVRIGAHKIFTESVS